VRKLVLTICLLSVWLLWLRSNGGNQNGQFPQKPKGHAPEMSSIAMPSPGDRLGRVLAYSRRGGLSAN